MRLRRVVPAVLSVALVIAFVLAGFVVGRDTTPPGGMAAALAGRKQQPVPTSVRYTVRDDGRIHVTVRGTFRAAEVRFRTATDRVRLRSGRLTDGRAKVLLPKSVRGIRARAKATPMRVASRWVKAVLKRSPTPVGPPTTDWVGLSTQDLNAVAAMRSFFGHQSVGGNILAAVPGVFTDHGVSAPPVREIPGPVTGGAILHDEIGTNGDPRSKVTDFADDVRDGLGQEVGVALMKFCYVDITAGTNVSSVFAHYRETIAALQHEYPGVAFVHVTVPLTTDSPGDNVAREKYNSLVRQQYADSGRLFDLAVIESTRPDGTRVSGSQDGATYYALYSGYASDNGHLNDRGARAAAAGLLDVMAHAAG